MPIQTQNVTVQLLDASGNPVAGATVTAKLDQTDYYTGGTITPALLSQVTDATGSTVFAIWPNALGMMGSTYHFRAWAPGSNARLLDVFASVPARDCNLNDILDLTPVPANSWALAVDAKNGIVGKTNDLINFYDAAHSELSYLVNHATAPRTYIFPDKSITVAGLDDIATMQTNVAITGGTIKGVALTLDNLDNTPVGANTPSTVKATTLTATGLATLQSRTLINGATDDGGTALQVLGAGKFSDAVTTRANLGLGSIVTQAASAVALTGGTIDGVVIGGTTPAAITGTTGTFSSLSATGVLQGGGGFFTGLSGPGSGAGIRLAYDTATSTGRVFAYDFTNGVAKNIAINYYGGRLLVGSGVADDGSSALQVAGSLSTTGMMKPGDLVMGAGGFKATGQITLGGTGAGVEVTYANGVGNIIGYDRTAGAYKPLSIGGSTITIGLGSSQRVLVAGVTDDGSTALQVNGAAKLSGLTSSYNVAINTSTGGSALTISNINGTSGNLISASNQTTTVFVMTNAGRLLLNGATDNGTDALQVKGTMLVNRINNPNSTTYLDGSHSVYTGSSHVFIATANKPWITAAILYSGQFQVTNNTTTKLFAVDYSGRVLVNGASDNGTDALQVAGSILSTGKHTITGGAWAVPAATSGIAYANVTDGLVLSGNGTTHDISFYSITGAGPALSVFHNTQRVGINQASDNGNDTLQVNGSGVFATTTDMYGLFVGDKSGGAYSGLLQIAGSAGQSGTVTGYGLIQTKSGSAAGGKLVLQRDAGRVLLGTVTDNGTDILQVAGTAHFSGTISSNGIIPNYDSSYSVGLSGSRYTAVYAVNGTIQTSDRRLKTDFTDSLGLDFINALNPVSYRWKAKKDDNGIHMGLIAQEVDDLMQRLGVKDFAGLSKPNTGYLGLNYSEFIAPLIRSVQELSERLKKVEAQAA